MQSLPAIPPFFPNPIAVCDWIQQSLAQGVGDPADSWHQGPITYIGDEGVPISKIIVWREWDERGDALTFYTDTRSAKWHALQRRNTISAVLYCPWRHVQLSFYGQASLSTGDDQDTEMFAALSPAQRQAYQSQDAPGAVFSVQSQPPLKTIHPDMGPLYFGRIRIQVSGFDFVSLHRQGHQRLEGASILAPESCRWVCP